MGCKTSLDKARVQRGTHTSDDLHEVLGVSLGEPPGGVHLVDHEGETTCAKFALRMDDDIERGDDKLVR